MMREYKRKGNVYGRTDIADRFYKIIGDDLKIRCGPAILSHLTQIFSYAKALQQRFTRAAVNKRLRTVDTSDPKRSIIDTIDKFVYLTIKIFL